MAREGVLSFTFQERSLGPDPAYEGWPSAFALSSRITYQVQAPSALVARRVHPNYRARMRVVRPPAPTARRPPRKMPFKPIS